MSKLRASAPAFEPKSAFEQMQSSSFSAGSSPDSTLLPADPFDLGLEVGVTEAELSELETVDAWVEELAALEEMEQEHLIGWALDRAAAEMRIH